MAIDENEVAKKLLDHDDEFAKVHQEIHDAKIEVLGAIDGLAKQVKHFNIEQVSTRVTLTRHEEDIKKIKKVLKLAH